MPTDHRAKLATIKRFDQLIAYLRDEMGWPISGNSFEDVDDLFYDFTADELGIDPKTAAKIQEIKRLRPLSPKQPWGVFFVKFEPKRLPVVALRRILGQVALKKRASANSAERAAWAADDLLFVSNYGEGEERQISFAHFSRARDGHDLPTLKVLGWDNRDTALHLDAVARELSEHLAWPDDDRDAEAWRTRWRAAFTLAHREVVTTSKELSIRLAELARNIRDRIKTALAFETDRGPLTRLMKAFQEALVHDLDADGFADMYAQTIAYGLLSARIADPHKKTADDFAAHMRTNPFLRELMETFLKVGGRRGKAGGPGIDFDELGVSEVVELLDDANMEAVVRDFGDRNPQEDPVIHFYELFLKEYDAKKRMQRGVFYTPRPVVSYIVRSVDELLRTEFGLADGLADTTTWGEMAKRHKDLKIPDGVSPDQDFVQILDPATGTGTFLVEVIDLIHKTLVAKWKAQGQGEKKIDALWNDYVPKHLLTRLHGYELLMAPYAIAHLKIGLKLYETGYRFGSEERARVYLTNSLEPASDGKKQMAFAEWLQALAHEAQAVNEVKRKQRFTTVIGNPPYARSSANKSDYLDTLLEPYKASVREERNIQPLSDDYIKFIRFGEQVLARSGCGVFGMITNNTFLAGRIHRGMRKCLLDKHRLVRVINLHGSGNVDFLGAAGSADENVFDIQQGVSITLMTTHAAKREISYGELIGPRLGKYEALSQSNVAVRSVTPVEPYYLIVPRSEDGEEEYKNYQGLADLFLFHSVSGKPGDDTLLVSIDEPDVIPKLKEFRRLLAADRSAKLTEAGRKLAARSPNRGFTSDAVVAYAYRPFDTRYTYYDAAIWTRAVSRLHDCVDGQPMLLTTKIVKDSAFSHVFVSRLFADVIFLSNTSSVNCYSFPSNCPSDALNFGAEGGSKRGYNLKLGAFAERLGGSVGKEAALGYIYSILHSPEYRKRYREPLQLDFPRIPITGFRMLFNSLAQLGGELIVLHLLESPKLAEPITEFVGGRDPEVEKVSWSKNAVWIDKAQTTGFKDVREEVWNFHIGGYQVCNKWLKERKGRMLSKDDIAHYQKIVVALAETIRLMKEIDEVIEQHGGWPGAFASSSTSAPNFADKDQASAGNAVPISGEEPPQVELYEIETSSMSKVAEPQSPVYDRSSSTLRGDGMNAPAEDLNRDELICQVRRLFIDGDARQRDAAISELARELGLEKISSRILDILDDTIRTAVRRGILENAGGTLRIGAKSIDQYERDFLKDQFLASLDGITWTEREEAIRAFARWLGFSRTGPNINEKARSLINGLIREARLESQGTRVRRVR